MKKTYFYKVYAYNRKLFIFISLFTGATLLCNFTGFEITPFFVWGMYSLPQPTDSSFEVLHTTLPGAKVIDPTSAGYPDNTRLFLNTPLEHYKEMMQDSNRADPTALFLERKLGSHYRWIRPVAGRVLNGKAEQDAFGSWYLGYLEEVLDHPVREASVWTTYVHFNAHQHIVQDSTILFATWKKP